MTYWWLAAPKFVAFWPIFLNKAWRRTIITLPSALGIAVWSRHNCGAFPLQRRGKEPTEHSPEVILNNFSTRLGHSIGRMFAALFPQDPQFVGRQVATFHNQRDFIFFRFHRWAVASWIISVTLILNLGSQINYSLDLWRYIFKNEKKVGIQELGPRFTLKLRSLQKGTFDSKFGEYEWVLKVSLSALKTFLWDARGAVVVELMEWMSALYS